MSLNLEIYKNTLSSMNNKPHTQKIHEYNGKAIYFFKYLNSRNG